MTQGNYKRDLVQGKRDLGPGCDTRELQCERKRGERARERERERERARASERERERESERARERASERESERERVVTPYATLMTTHNNTVKQYKLVYPL